MNVKAKHIARAIDGLSEFVRVHCTSDPFAFARGMAHVKAGICDTVGMTNSDAATAYDAKGRP